VDQPDNQDRIVFEYRFLKKDGIYCWLSGERMRVRDAQGTPLYFVGSWSDITDRKKTEETLRLSEARYHSLYESMMDPYVQVDLNGKIELFNQSYQAMLGYEPEELRNLTYMDLTPERWHAFETAITESQIWTRGYSEIYEKEYIRKDGTVFPVELRSALMRDNTGKPFKMWAIVRDISERKKAQETLRISEERYRSLYDGMTDAYVAVKMDGTILHFNQAYQKMVGYDVDELHNLTYYDLTPEKWRAQDERILAEQVLPRGHSEVFEKEYRRKDGTIFFIDPAFGSAHDSMALPFHGVYRLGAKGEAVALARWDRRPGGIALSPDGKTLYVANGDERTIHAFDLDRQGNASGDRVLVSGIEGVPNALRTDDKGRLYVAAHRVFVYSPEGQRLSQMETSERPTSLAFGAAGGRTLFIATRTTIYRVEFGESR